MPNIENVTYDVEFMSCVLDKSDDMCVIDSDSHFSEFVGVHPSKIKQRKLNFYDLVVPQDRERITKIINKKDSPHVYFDFYIKGKGGEMSLVHCTGVNVEESKLCHITMVDITRSVEREKALKAKAKEMNHLIDLVTGGVCLFKVHQDMHLEILYANETCCRFFGTTKDTFASKTYLIDELIHPEDKSKAFMAIGSSMATKKPFDLELRIVPHKDQFIWCKMDAGIHRYDKDNLPIFHAMFSDITKLKEVERKEQKQSQMLTKVLKNAPGPLFVSDYDDPLKITIVSEDFVKLTGIQRADLFEKNDGYLTPYILDKDVNRIRDNIKIQDDSGVKKSTYSLQFKSGKVITVYDRRKVIELDSGEKSMIGMLRDVSTIRFDETDEI